jgi:hypothetical protein
VVSPIAAATSAQVRLLAEPAFKRRRSVLSSMCAFPANSTWVSRCSAIYACTRAAAKGNLVLRVSNLGLGSSGYRPTFCIDSMTRRKNTSGSTLPGSLPSPFRPIATSRDPSLAGSRQQVRCLLIARSGLAEIAVQECSRNCSSCRGKMRVKQGF